MSGPMKIAVLSGDGIGPEVMAQAQKVLGRVVGKYGLDVAIETALVGGIAYEEVGCPLPAETKAVCDWADAVLFGSIGGPKWAELPYELTPEGGALLPLRKHLNLFANLREIRIFPALVSSSPLRSELVSGLHLRVVRELTGGLYFAEPKMLCEDSAVDTCAYTRVEVERILKFALIMAKLQGLSVVSVDKANVLLTSKLWREVAEEKAEELGVELRHLYVDNAAMQLVLNPQQFNGSIMVTENLMGDILTDLAAALTGGLGMVPSASLGVRPGFGLYEPAGGSAPDIAGKDIANPSAQILSLAMMFRYSFDRDDIARLIEYAVESILQDGYRTQDIMPREPSQGIHKVGTSEMGDLIAQRIVGK